MTIHEERIALRRVINRLIAEISILSQHTISYPHELTTAILNDAQKVLNTPVDKENCQLVEAASTTLNFIQQLLSVPPLDAIDLLTNYGDDVEDRLIEILAKYPKNDQVTDNQRPS